MRLELQIVVSHVVVIMCIPDERREESGDDKIRSALVYLASSAPVDRQLLSSLHSVTSESNKGNYA